MFKNPFRKREQAEECSLHSSLSGEEREAKALLNGDKLRRASALALPKLEETDPFLGWVLSHSSVADVIPNAEMDAAYLFFPKTQSCGRQILGLTWDWIEAREEGAIADHIAAHVRELLAEGKFPAAQSDYNVG